MKKHEQCWVREQNSEVVGEFASLRRNSVVNERNEKLKAEPASRRWATPREAPCRAWWEELSARQSLSMPLRRANEISRVPRFRLKLAADSRHAKRSKKCGTSRENAVASKRWRSIVTTNGRDHHRIICPSLIESNKFSKKIFLNRKDQRSFKSLLNLFIVYRCYRRTNVVKVDRSFLVVNQVPNYFVKLLFLLIFVERREDNSVTNSVVQMKVDIGCEPGLWLKSLWRDQ